jgi:hypothetical protein
LLRFLNCIGRYNLRANAKAGGLPRFFITWKRTNRHLQNREGAIYSATPELL